MDNVENGFDLYRMDTGNFVRTFLTRKATKTYPKGVAFADRSGLIIGGSDHGKVYVFERKTGRLVKRLKHAGSGGVEAIAVSPILNSCWRPLTTFARRMIRKMGQF